MTAGRKRTFAKDEALDKAMKVFWENGYSGTSLSDLTAELGINKPSLYAAFGNKEKLFKAAIEHYMSAYGAATLQRLFDAKDDSVKESLRTYLYDIIDLQTDKKTPGGCFVVNSYCESGGHGFPEETSALLADKEMTAETIIYRFLDMKMAEGKLNEETNLKQLAAYFTAIIYGLAVHSRSGKTKSELQSIADFSLSNLPIKENSE